MTFELMEVEYLAKIDEQVRMAERLIALEGFDPEVDEDAYLAQQEMLFHCEVCTVREILEVVWPSVQQYIDWLKSQIPELMVEG